MLAAAVQPSGLVEASRKGLGQRLGWRIDTQNSDAVVQVLGLDFQCSWGGLFKNWRYLPLLSVTYRYEALFSERA
jgi:hypothetical protein